MTPSKDPPVHPEAEEFAAFLNGGLDPAERQRIAAHVEHCRKCREVLDLARKLDSDDGPAN